MLDFISKYPFLLSGLNMSEIIKLLKANDMKTTPEDFLKLFEKTELGFYHLTVNDCDLIELAPPDLDEITDKKFRPKKWQCTVIGGA
jgi:hypothetical protein